MLSPDKGIFVRLPKDHESQKLSPAGVREVAIRKIPISPSLIGKIKSVNSVLALSTYSTEAREAIIKRQVTVCLYQEQNWNLPPIGC